MAMYADDDAQLQIALELSKKTAEEESRNRNGERVHDLPKVHDIKLQEEIIGAHLRSGFKDLKEQNLFSDITLEVGDEKIPSHRIVLCAWSETFKVMLENDTWKESQQKNLKINVDEKEYEVFKILLHYMYYGEAKVTTEHVIPLLSLANYYAVLPLKENCGQILGEQLNDDNVFHLLDLCEKFSVNNLRTLCAEYLAENFGALLKADKLQELDPETWAEMLKSDEIQVTSEEEVFNAILPNVRFPFLSSPFFIENVDNNSLLTSIPIIREIIHETYKYKVYPKAVTSIRTRPRKTASYFENVPNGVKVSDDRLTASNTNTNMQWVTTKISPPLNKGNRYREILLGQMSMNGFFIGVATSTVLNSSAVNFYPGQYGNSWSYEGSGGSIYHNGGTTYYGGPYRTGDRIGIEVDLDQGKLRFYKNGTSLGDVSSYHFKSSDLGSDDLFACVTFYTSGDSVTLLPVAAPSTDSSSTTSNDDRSLKKPKTSIFNTTGFGSSFKF